MRLAETERMNRSSMKEEEQEEEGEVDDRKFTFYLWHPCSFLEETLKAFLRCLGVESSGRSRTKGSMKKKEEKSSLLKQVRDNNAYAESVTTSQNCASNSNKTNQEAADPPSSTITQITNATAMERRGPRKPPLSKGSPPQHN